MPNPTPPAGGFEQGGWYEGRQYWNGTFSAPGVIHNESDQQGAGQAVSPEVLKQTSIAAGLEPDANYNYIQKQQLSADNLGSYLSNFQSGVYNSGAGDLSVGTSSNAPTPINRLDMYNKQRSEMGVADLETELNQIKEQERLIQANTRAKQVNEEGKPVAMGVISGRVSEEQRQAQMDLDFLNVRKATLVDELATKYSAINTYINFAGLDYQDAAQKYESDFNRNLQMAQFISGEKKDAATTARANLATIMNAIASGNMSYGSMGADQQLQIQKLEMQSGLPVGTVSKLQMTANDKIIGWSDDKTQALMMGANGQFVVKDTGLKASASNMSAAEITRQAKEALIARAKSGKPLIDYSGKKDDIMSLYRSYLDPNEIYAIYNANSPWGKAKESAEELSAYGITDPYKY